jgi:hypothetical protein
VARPGRDALLVANEIDRVVTTTSCPLVPSRAYVSPSIAG